MKGSGEKTFHKHIGEHGIVDEHDHNIIYLARIGIEGKYYDRIRLFMSGQTEFA